MKQDKSMAFESTFQTMSLIRIAQRMRKLLKQVNPSNASSNPLVANLKRKKDCQKKKNMYRKFLQQAVEKHPSRLAIRDLTGEYNYEQLFHASQKVARHLRTEYALSKGDRVCLLGEKTFEYAAVQLGIWSLGGISLTLLPTYPANELKYFVQDAAAKLVVASDVLKTQDVLSMLHDSDLPRHCTPSSLIGRNPFASSEPIIQTSLSEEDAAGLVYTSGSTGAPKGVVTTHGACASMIDGMIHAWGWQPTDSILHFLPLHHVHGWVNKLLTPLCVGASVEFTDFHARTVLDRLNSESSSPSVFMGVPTIYAKLVEQWESPEMNRPRLKNLETNVRLFVCGSAPLPVHLFETFSQLSQQRILERYGMTEIGMALSNPLVPQEKRIPGFVGTPMPCTQVKIVNLDSEEPRKELPPGEPGDLLVKGKSVFKEYWGRGSRATRESEFTQDGYFKTGDIAVFDEQEESYKIVGRKSVDIIKSGGYKLSALEIERMVLINPKVQECQVVGVPDEIWGESVVAIVVLKNPQQGMTLEELTEFAQQHVASYKIPKRLVVMDEIPKNAMGKVNKKSLKQQL